MQTNSSFILEIGNSSGEDSSSVGITLDNNGLHSVWIWICSAEEHTVPSYELSQDGLVHPRGNHAGPKETVQCISIITLIWVTLGSLAQRTVIIQLNRQTANNYKSEHL